MKRLLALTLALPIATLGICIAAMTPAGAITSEPTCSFTATGDITTSTVSTFNLSCSDVTGASVWLSIPITTGDLVIIVESADLIYGTGPTYALLPTSFTLNESSANPSDNSTPSAAYVAGTSFVGSGALGAMPDLAVAQTDASNADDGCLTAGTGCGTPTFSWTDTTTTTTTSTTTTTMTGGTTPPTDPPATELSAAATSMNPGLMAMVAGLAVILPIVGIVIRKIINAITGGN